jgi:hypothetical protein
MKKSFLIMAFVSLFMVVAICSCDNNENGEEEEIPTSTSAIPDNILTVRVENGDSYNDEVDTVKLVYSTNKDEDEYVELARATYSNGGFTLQLPETVSDAYLWSLKEWADDEGLKVSNPNVKTVDFDDTHINAYKLGEYAGTFVYLNAPADSYSDSGGLMYVTDDVIITGSIKDGSFEEKYSLNLKKGWNFVYGIESGNNTDVITTAAPSGMKWYHYEMW